MGNLKNLFTKPIIFAILSVAALTVLIPLMLIIFAAFKDPTQIAGSPFVIPANPRLENIIDAWVVGRFGQYFGNSIVVAIPTVIGVLIFSTMAAYPLAILKFPGKNVVFYFILAGLTIPLHILIIPIFYQMRTLGLLNTRWALILPQIALVFPFGVFLMRGFMAELPREIFDAAQIDGCSFWGMFWHIVLPLTKPALSSLLVFAFVWTWNQFLLAIVLIRDEALRTLPIGLEYFRGRFQTDVSLVAAGTVIVMVPTILVYLLFQHQVIAGLTSGALKE